MRPQQGLNRALGHRVFPEPIVPPVWRNDDRHAVMQRRQQRVRVRSDDGEGFDAFIFRQSPFIPQSGQLCAARACSRVCTVKAPHLAALMTKAFFRKCQNQMKEGRAAEAGGTFCESRNQISGIDSSARRARRCPLLGVKRT